MNIPKSLRVALAYRNMSQADLAKSSNISKATISFIATGKRSVTSERLEAICNALDYKASEFIALGESNE